MNGRAGVFSRPAVLGLLLVAAFSLWLRAAFPVQALGGSIYDDGLFLQLAASIRGGHWLGAYDNRTMVKGPFYPLFIVAAFLLHVPLKAAEQLAYLGACALMLRIILARTGAGAGAGAGTEAGRGGKALAVVTFVLLSLNPMLWHTELARVIREGVYVSQALGIVGLAAAISFPVFRGSPIAAGIGLGMLGAAFWTTREEGVWLLPAVAVIAAWGILREATPNWGRPAGSRRPAAAWPRRTAIAWACAGAAFAVVVLSVAAENRARYGVFTVTEVKAEPFLRAYGALARIRPDHWQRYIVFPQDARDRAYAVSPAARELQPTLDGAMGAQWGAGGCATMHVTPCTGVPAGWFQWVLREAVARAGHYSSAPAAAAFYDRLAHEIDAACDARRIACLPRRATLAPPFRWQYVGDTLRRAGPMLTLLLHMGGAHPGPVVSTGTRAQLDAVADLVGPVAPASAAMLDIHGWVEVPAGDVGIDLRPPMDGQADASLAVTPAPDITAAHPGARSLRFALQTDCARADCDLIVRSSGQPDLDLPLARLRHGPVFGGSGLVLYIDSVAPVRAFPATQRLRRLQLQIAAEMAGAYSRASLWLWPLGCAGVLLALATRGRGVAPGALALAAGSVVAVVSRVLLLSYLDVTAIPSYNDLYLSPASPLVIVSITTGVYVGGQSVRLVWQAWRSATGRVGRRC